MLAYRERQKSTSEQLLFERPLNDKKNCRGLSAWHIARPYPPGHSHTAILADVAHKSRYGSQKAVLFRFKSALFLRPLQWVLRSFTGKLGVVRKLVLPRYSLLLCACRLLTQCAVRTQRAHMYALDISIPHRPGSDCAARLDGAFMAADHIVRTGRGQDVTSPILTGF